MSFAMTKDAMRERRKTVTRRLGWKNLKPGERLLAVSALRQPKEKVEIFGVIEIVDVYWEPPNSITASDIIREGFRPGTSRTYFVEMFTRANNIAPSAPVRRIEFRFVESAEVGG